MADYCSIDECAAKAYARSWCRKHYQRWWSSGTTDNLDPRFQSSVTDPDDIAARILERSEWRGTCLVWTGTTKSTGYGLIGWRARKWATHRAIWTATIGEIPAGLTVDHLCLNKLCVNTDHMEIVTVGENAHRGQVSWAPELAEMRRNSATCRNGHPWAGDNIATYGKQRRCRECSRAAWRRWKARQSTTA